MFTTAIVLAAVVASLAVGRAERAALRRRARDAEERVLAMEKVQRAVLREAADTIWLYQTADKHNQFALRRIVEIIRPDVDRWMGIDGLRRELAISEFCDEVLGPEKPE